MRTHTIEGQRMLEQVGGALAAIGRAVRASHERWDGKGYPDGLAGEEIPLAARIVAACDAFHAMTSDRPYRAALPQEHAIRELRACAGTQFDPEVGEVLVALVEGSGPEVRPRREPPVAASPERRHAPPGHGARRSFNYSSLVGELEADAEHIAAVAQATRALAQSTDRDAARAAICAAAVRVSGAAAAVLLEPENGRLVETARAGGVAGSPMAQLDFSPDGPLFLPNAWDHPGTPHGFLSDNHGVSAHLQPVTREGARLGLVAVTWEERLERLPEAVAAMMSLLAAEAAVALERTKLLEHLRAAVRTDDLTGLLKRSAWEEELEREVSRARREQRSLCVLMLDLDHFKRLNDTRGHSAGDELLREVATAWRSELRLSDSLARYGGDEFVALLPSCSLADGRRLAERLSSVLPPGQGCSCGLAEWDAGESPAQLVRRADAALLEAKQGGRNQVAVAA
jgi:diguanylate cyclase (GGDEF)-like protein